MTVPLCINCKHFRRDSLREWNFSMRLAKQRGFCEHPVANKWVDETRPSKFDPVAGYHEPRTPLLAICFRAKQFDCGPDGTLFKAKP